MPSGAAGALAGAVVVAVALAGCSPGRGSEAEAAREARKQAAAAALQERLAQMPGVTSADMGYIDVFGQSGSARAEVTVTRATDLE